MKKNFLLIFLLYFFCVVNAIYADSYNSISLQQASETELVFYEKTTEGFSARSSINAIEFLEYQSPMGPFIGIKIKGHSKNYDVAGRPHLPVLTKLVEIPAGASAKVIVKSYDLENISLDVKYSGVKIGPMQPSVSKNIPSELVEFVYDAASYRKDEFSNISPVTFETVGTTRGIRLGKLKVSPLRYNPVQNSLHILNNLSFEVVYENVNDSEVQKIKQKKYSSAFQSTFAAIETLPETASARKAVLKAGAESPQTYVIVAHESFKGNTSLDQFISWKREKDFKVILAYTGDDGVGTTKESIRGYLENLYNSSSSPSYALFIGDVDKIPAWDGRTGSHVTDLYYFTYDDEPSGYIPSVYYGRFPADNANELDAIISKTLQYEKFQFSSAEASDYLDNYMFIVGDDTDYALSHGNAQVNYAVNEYFPTIYKYLYTEERSSLASEIKYNFNKGMGFVNFTGHCDTLGWYNFSLEKYYFASSDLLNLKNKDKYGFVIGNCCLSNKFDNDDSDNEADCFGELIIKQRNGGAVGYIGAANDTFWDEDFYWSVGDPTFDIQDINAGNHSSENTQPAAYDGLFYTGNDESQLYTTAGQIVYRGNLSVSQTDSPDDQYYWEIYCLMGDPALTPYLSDPETKNVENGTQDSGSSAGSESICFIGTTCDAF